MTTFASELTTGVVIALVSACVTLALARFWRNVMLPWIDEMSYDEPRFEGEWTAVETFSDEDPGSADEKGEYRMVLKRRGHRVSGTYTGVNGPDKDSVSSMEGSYRNLILTVTWRPVDKRALDRGTLTLKLTKNGKEFVGFGLYYSPKTERVHTSACVAVPRAMG